MDAELTNIEPAIALADADPRLGYHHEAHGHQYDAARLRRKVQHLRAWLNGE